MMKSYGVENIHIQAME